MVFNAWFGSGAGTPIIDHIQNHYSHMEKSYERTTS